MVDPPTREAGDLGSARADLCGTSRVREAHERVGVGDVKVVADESDAENLFYDLTERLESDYDETDFADRPIGELVARICRDLGVTPDWSLWQDEAWAIEAREASACSATFLATSAVVASTTKLVVLYEAPPSSTGASNHTTAARARRPHPVAGRIRP